MKVLSIDLGTYSVKFLYCSLDRKSIIVEKITSIPLELSNKATPQEIEDKQIEILQQFFKENSEESKKIIQIPSKWLTSRFLNFPVSSKKKAEQMLPFQLDRELPFNLTNVQYASQFIPKRNSFFTLTSIIDLNRFDLFFRKLETANILPDIITSEASIIQSYIHQRKFEGSSCILDIGHETTKAFFIQDKKVVSSHIAHIAGKTITENISRTYQISYQEAEEFKLTKSFFLTDSQYNEVNEDQKAFALMMNGIFSSFLLEFKRWELGHKITHGEGIKTIYLCGGSSRIKNFNNFLTQKLSINVLHLDLLQDNNIKDSSIEGDEYLSNYIPFLMAQTAESKLLPINFRKGIYSSGEQTEIPFYSAFFIGARVLIVAFIIFISLLFERVFLLKEEKNLETQITKLIKRSELNIIKRDQRLYQMKPLLILNKLKSRYVEIEKEIELIQNISKTNAILPILNVKNILKSESTWYVKLYEKTGSFITIEIECDSELVYESIKSQLSFLPYKNLSFQDDPKSKVLHLEFEDTPI